MVKSGKGTVSSSSLKKSELVAVLANRAASSRERNRAVKLLKKFDPNPHKDMDDHFDLKSVRVNKFDQLQAYMYVCSLHVPHTQAVNQSSQLGIIACLVRVSARESCIMW
eukprot:GHVS01064229.1.p1 GENE.GHVS01064229.1~~GHVS01064229.1.p1  ORF type:complete len:110 (+),score=8.10 GHVS01064229.1:221-550(+)